ncbi:cysteine hydrolase family protein [Dinghuibacter silviterrae]|uniref:Nicotinamidase-related amidase n=1 Tax=Dinghuibacter silviterrae TaxID=1539049 RepID=A0A4R8DT30_9BACT|nr:isochorismatase family cysteine hydrolase [Dinghuibacter silviterrae]TDX01434.1 nicotinamidase-related amidase [Dinghuibacter silviterrae]
MKTALLVMDMQSAFLSRFPDMASVTKSVATAIAHARAKDIPVIYVVVGFRDGAPEISPNNKGFMAAKPMVNGVTFEQFTAIDASVAPAAGEITVVKRRVCAFTGSDLEVVLRAYGVGHLVLTGIATSGVVLSTVREAADKDYVLTVLSDGCADGDADVHQLLMTKVFPRQAEVMTAAEWVG